MTQEAPPSDAATHVAAKRRNEKDVVQEVLTRFYGPLLATAHASPAAACPAEWKEVEELVGGFAQYLTSLHHVPHSSMEIRIPDIDCLSEARSCEASLRLLESAVVEWTESLSNALHDETCVQVAAGSGPAAEVEFWRRRLAFLSALTEQLQSKTVCDILAIVDDVTSGHSKALRAFADPSTALKRRTAESRDNVKFLTMLERHFAVLATGSLTAVTETLPTMMNTLRTIWIMSRYYNDDQKMGGLFRKIAIQIGDRAEAAVDIKTLFKQDAGHTTALLANATHMLEAWYTAYMQVRETIEASRRDARWEFSRSMLFERTQHMALVCRDLSEMVDIVDDFFKFLGPELKAVVGETSGIDQILETVVVMCEAVEAVPFDVFDVACSEPWSKVKAQFHTDNESIKQSTRELIDASFRKLRSSEAAFELLKSFESIQSRGAIQQQIMSKAKDVLRQFSREMDVARSIFDVHQQHPPVARNQPPVAGSIQWSRRLFARIKRTMTKLASFLTDLRQDVIGIDVHEKYMSFARKVMLYEKERIRNWESKATALCLRHLKQPILKRDASTGDIRANFAAELRVLIKETKSLDKMGFALPDIVVNVALQDQSFQRAVEDLDFMLERYHHALHHLSSIERALLEQPAREMTESLQPGFSPLNWHALGISDFVESGNKAIAHFVSVVSQVRKSTHGIEGILSRIAKTALFVEPDKAPTEFDVFVDTVTTNIDEAAEKLLETTQSIPPLLKKIEECVFGSRSGKCPAMKSFYAYWEKLLYQSLTATVIGGMKAFEQTLRHRSHSKQAAAALFKVSLSLSHPEIVVSPSVNDVNKSLGKLSKKFVECTKLFVRWMDGTCIAAPPVQRRDEEEPFVFSFYLDISAHPQVIKAVLGLNHYAQKAISAMHRYVESWRRHQSLWKTERSGVIEKFKARRPSSEECHERLAKYDKLATTLLAQARCHAVEFLTVDSCAIATSVSHVARQWLQATSDAMKDIDAPKVASVRERITDVEERLKGEPTTADDLKAVLTAIASIRQQYMNLEVALEDLEERFRTRVVFADDAHRPACEADLREIQSVKSHWLAVNEAADAKEVDIQAAKKTFTAETTTQAAAFVGETEAFWTRFKEQCSTLHAVPLDEGSAILAKLGDECRVFVERRDDLLFSQRLFEQSPFECRQLNQATAELKKLRQIFDVYAGHASCVKSYAQVLWSEIDIKRMTDDVNAALAHLRSLRDLKQLPVYASVETAMVGFAESLPLMKILKSDAIRPRHWQQLMTATGQAFEMDAKTFTLGSLFSMQLHDHTDEVQKITTSAVKEQTIEFEIKKLHDSWKAQRFDIAPYKKDGKDRTFVLKSTEEILLMLEDMTLNVQSMLASPFVRPLLEDVQSWEQKLSLIGECIETWMTVQRKWMYLESIFIGSDDIRQQLPNEAKQFDAIDAQWIRIMSETQRHPNVLDACSVPGRYPTWVQMAERLENCQKSLSEYLDTKRSAFPRFYFISDDELLSILGSSDPTAVQEHMLKIFDNCAQLRFGRNDASVVGMTSAEGEGFAFLSPVAVDGPVEQWMQSVETEMRQTLFQKSKEGVFHYAKAPRNKWMHECLGMVTLLGSQVWWTFETEDAFERVKNGDKHAMKRFARKLGVKLTQLTRLVRTDLEAELRRKVNTLMILDVHGRDIVETFVRDSVLDASDFAWESQLRFYWNRSKDDVEICQCSGVFDYGYEYMGLNGRLVITALTDRCYMTLTTALTFKLGGAPAGPAGTGKTETTKDLAKSLALLCVVFNCGEGLDYKAMGSIFSGLVQSGAWGCFDEFNRIEAEVLSVVSSQIKQVHRAFRPGGGQNLCRQIQEALKLGATRFSFEGKDVAVRQSTGIFITMNPGYAGRTELPDNLKALFRPVTMVVPDMEQICEIMLFSEGFDQAKILAKKMTVLYKLAKEQLSKQYHYDFGLRALKSVLTMAGTLKRESQGVREDVVLMRALRDMNLPKFTFDDVPLFRGLINDLFPGLDCPRLRYEKLNDVVEHQLERRGYQVLPDQVDKIVQLYEVMQTRHTTMVVGQSGGGKSVILQTLAQSLTQLGTKTTLHVVNPKAQSLNALYGVLDPDTRDWTDGLLSHIFRELNRPLHTSHDSYLVFDGDVDAVWVENMNSVMDDNRLLTLPNGERIRLQSHVKLLFEVADLQYASPATISRCGMVYVDERNLGYQPYLQTWLAKRPANERPHLERLVKKYVPRCVRWLEEGVDDVGDRAPPIQAVHQNGLNVVRQLCALLDATLREEDEHVQHDAKASLRLRLCQHLTVVLSQVMEAVFLWCVVWSFGAVLVEKPQAAERSAFDAFLKRIADYGVVDGDHVAVTQLPSRSLFDYNIDIPSLQWTTWEQYVTPYTHPPSGNFAEIFVPTVDTVRSTWLLNLFVQAGHPCLFVGESGTAKTATIQRYLHGLPTNANTILGLNFSSRTRAGFLQDAVEGMIEKRTKDTFGPPVGKALKIFVDDLNMPQVDSYGTQQPIAWLKLFVERGGFYDRGKELNWKNVRDTHVVAAMGPAGGARSVVDPRCVSLFRVFSIPFPSQETLRVIFGTILRHHLSGAPSELQQLCGSVTQATAQIYDAVVEMLPPTPSRFHYVFNLRDLSRVFEGLLSLRLHEPRPFLRLWRNECMRVFYDRLICEEDRVLVDNRIKDIIDSVFPDEAAAVRADPLLFSQRAAIGDRESYGEVDGYEKTRQCYEEMLVAYNQQKKPMHLVLFDDAVDHLSRVYRTLRLPRGHTLLVGVGGLGKKSMARLVSFACGYDVFEITLTRTYGEAEFRDDLKKLYGLLGAENKKVTLLFADEHVVHESFLEMLNSMLTSGMIPALFDASEKDAVTHEVREELESDGEAPTKEQCWNRFVARCQENLHVVFAMSPVGNALRTRCRNYPALVNNTVIHWFDRWPEEALRSVAGSFLKDSDVCEEKRQMVVEHMVYVHKSVIQKSAEYYDALKRHYYVTPKNYLDFIATYKRALTEERTKGLSQKERLSGGLEKLIQAATEVDAMQKELSEATVVVERATVECNALLESIATNTVEVEKKQRAAQEKEEELKVESERIAVEKAEAEAALEAAIPALEEAAAALKDIKKDDITEIRSFAKPHILVQKVCEAVVILRGLKDVSWSGAKTMMADSQFLKTLLEFDKDGLTDKQVKRVKEYMKDPKFAVAEVKTISTAGAGLLKWVFAMVNYNNVAKTVEPKRKKVADSEKHLRMAQKDLARTKDDVQNLNTQLTDLRRHFEEKTVEQGELQEKANVMARRLDAASRLITGLGSERERWTRDMAAIEASLAHLLGDCLLTSAFLSYLGAFTQEYRRALLHDWQNAILSKRIPLTQPFALERVLTTDVETTLWASQGLPPDELSIQNGILASRSQKWPLCIDPQMQAHAWIKTKEGAELDGRVKSFSDGDFLKQLELAIQYGLPFLFENLEEHLDPVIDPVLEKNRTIEGSRQVVMLGDKEVEWDDSFRLYMTTKLANPHYGPEVSGKTMLINFAVTQQGLTDQLLNVVVGHERRDLEERRASLVLEMSENKAALKGLEATLLHELSKAQGNILDNGELIQTLEETKTKATEIAEKLQTSCKTAAEIETACQQYRPVAKRGAILFFVLESLARISNMYEYSLAAFLGVFHKSLVKAPPSEEIAQRLCNILDTLTLDIYHFTSLGLFEKHKLLFSFQMTVKIEEGEGRMQRDLLEFFAKGNTALERSPAAKPFEWLPEQAWHDMTKLQCLSTDSVFASLAEDVARNELKWKAYYEHEAAEEEEAPLGAAREMTPFEKLLLLRCLRVDRVTVAVTSYVTGTLGKAYVQPPVLHYQRLFEQSSATTPILFVLSPGADPVFDVMRLGERLGFKPGHRLKHIALGQGMGKKAEELLSVASQRGLWVMLQNCHLLPKWLKTLEKWLEKTTQPHSDFRLWLTTDPTESFPLGILQRCVKVVTEPPNGLKPNMRSSYSKLDDAALSQCPHAAFKPLVYILSFFHAVVQERRKYGKLGWNVPYDFNETDFRISMTLIATYLSKSTPGEREAIPWKTLKYLIGEAMYGGRVSDNDDRRVLRTYLDEYIGDFIFDEFGRFWLYHHHGVKTTLPRETNGDVAHYRSIVEAFPDVLCPTVFGLSANADISYHTDRTRQLWTDLVRLQAQSSGGGAAGGPSREMLVQKIVDDLRERIPEPFDVQRIRKGTPRPEPLQLVLHQELDHWNRLVRFMTASLAELDKALSGEVGFSSDLEVLADALYNGQLPSSWARLAPQTDKSLGHWMEGFAERHRQYRLWIEKGTPKVLWLSGLHVPETFLAALIQTACRREGWPLDKATLSTDVTSITDPDAIVTPPEMGCYVHGLYLEGAGWDLDGRRLTQQKPKETLTAMPIIRLLPEASRESVDRGVYRAPVYVTQRRRDAMGKGHVFDADLRSDEHASHWTLQGVALVLNIA